MRDLVLSMLERACLNQKVIHHWVLDWGIVNCILELIGGFERSFEANSFGNAQLLTSVGVIRREFERNVRITLLRIGRIIVSQGFQINLRTLFWALSNLNAWFLERGLSLKTN